MWFLAVALGAPPTVPSCREVREAVRLGDVRVEDEDLYVRSLGLRCRAAAAALGSIGTDSARAVLAEREPWIRSYGMLHDVSDEGLDAVLAMWDAHELWGGLPDGHPLAAPLEVPPVDGRGLVCRLDIDPVRLDVTAVEAHIQRAIQGDPASEAWLWEVMAEPWPLAAVAQVLGSLSEGDERASLLDWAAAIREDRDGLCADAWGRGTECFVDLWAEGLPVQGSPMGTWWVAGSDVVRRDSGEVVVRLPVEPRSLHWSPSERLLVGTDLGSGALWFVWPEEGRFREVRPLMASTSVGRVDEETVRTRDAVYDARTGEPISAGGFGFRSLGPWRGGSCSATRGGFVRCVSDRGREVLLEGRLQPYSDNPFDLRPKPILGGAVSPDGRRVAVVYPDVSVDLFDLAQEGQQVEKDWPPVLGPLRAGDGAPRTQVALGDARGARAADGAGLVRTFEEAAFSNDGRAFVFIEDALGHDDGGLQSVRRWQGARVRVWSAEDGVMWLDARVAAGVGLAGFEGDGALRLHTPVGHVVRVAMAQGATPEVEDAPEVDGVVSPPVDDPRCVELEVVQGGVKRMKRFQENGLPCD